MAQDNNLLTSMKANYQNMNVITEQKCSHNSYLISKIKKDRYQTVTNFKRCTDLNTNK